jgi:hypothetical protein
MKLKIAALAGALALFAAIPGVAQAATWWGYTTVNANFRATPGGMVINTIPANSRVRVMGQAGSWDQVAYGGQVGYVAASLITSQYVQTRPPVFIGPAPSRGYWHKPYWDRRYGAWYDGRRWYRNGIWYNSPNFGFGFSFGG